MKLGFKGFSLIFLGLIILAILLVVAGKRVLELLFF